MSVLSDKEILEWVASCELKLSNIKSHVDAGNPFHADSLLSSLSDANGDLDHALDACTLGD